MPRVAVVLPKIGLVMETVRVTRWLKNVGESVEIGEALLEVETEKSVVEIESAVGGRLEQLLVPAGQEAKVGDQVAWVESTQSPAPGAPPVHSPTPAAAPSARAVAPASAARGAGRIRSTPAARRLGAQRGVELRDIAGSGPGGRVQLADVSAVAEAASPVPARGTMSPMQRALARAMSLSNATVPQFTVERSVDCSAMQQMAPRLRRRGLGDRACTLGE